MTSDPTDPDVIYLEPYPGSPDGRMWCEDPVWDEIPECEGQSVPYVRADSNPRWYVVVHEDGSILAGGTREEMEGYVRAAEGRTLHGVYIGPEVEVDGRA